MKLFLIDTRKIGGLRFIKIGKLCFSFCVTKEFRPIGGKTHDL